MPKKAWNDFVRDHPKAICVVTVFAAGGAKLGLAADGRQIPTPYKILPEVISSFAKGDWTIRSEKAKKQTIAHIIFADKNDAVEFNKIFRLSKNSNSDAPPPPCAELYQFSYNPDDYRRLLKGAGYIR